VCNPWVAKEIEANLLLHRAVLVGVRLASSRFNRRDRFLFWLAGHRQNRALPWHQTGSRARTQRWDQAEGRGVMSSASSMWSRL
jgi:hypothetical protein